MDPSVLAFPVQAFDPNQNPSSDPGFGLLSVIVDDPTNTVVVVSVDPTLVPATLPATIPILDALGNGVVGQAPLVNPTNAFQLLGFVTRGQLHLTSFGTSPGDSVVGQLSGDIVTFLPVPPNPLPPLSAGTSGGPPAPSCGLGAELVLVLPLMALFRRRRRGAGVAAGALLAATVLWRPRPRTPRRSSSCCSPR